MVRVVLVAAVALAAAFAGCSGKDAGADVSDALGSTDSDSLAAANATANRTVNHAPTANLTAAGLTGVAPFNVTFQLSGSDQDGDNLAWRLAAGNVSLGNGTSLPANVTHGFVDAGNYSVLLTVSDGKNATQANVTVVVTAAVAAPTLEELCPTDAAAVDLGVGYYATPMDSASEPGSMWIYEESNGMPGLQRNDDTVPTECPTPDTVVF